MRWSWWARRIWPTGTLTASAMGSGSAFLARAVCQQPQVLLLDEPPLSGYQGQDRTTDHLQKLAHEQQLAVIVTLHELDMAQKIADAWSAFRRTAFLRPCPRTGLAGKYQSALRPDGSTVQRCFWSTKAGKAPI